MICRRANREARAVGRELPNVFSQSSSPQVAIANGLIRPGVEILSGESAALRSLRPDPSSRSLGLFIGLFDPIVALARERLETSGGANPERGHELELMIARLSDEQVAAARRVGLTACSVDFTRALGDSK
jgi:hypothetical protein